MGISHSLPRRHCPQNGQAPALHTLWQPCGGVCDRRPEIRNTDTALAMGGLWLGRELVTHPLCRCMEVGVRVIIHSWPEGALFPSGLSLG